MDELLIQVRESFNQNFREHNLVAQSNGSQEIVLNGFVPTFYTKQLVQESVGRFIKARMWNGESVSLNNEIVVGRK